jgi:hypothetical protein
MLAQYLWPGNIAAAKTRIPAPGRAQPVGSGIGPEHHFARDCVYLDPPAAACDRSAAASRRAAARNSLADAVDGLEREIIEANASPERGNISRSARTTLGLTRRGLYLKLRRLARESVRFGNEVFGFDAANFFSSFVGNAIVASTIPCYLSQPCRSRKGIPREHRRSCPSCPNCGSSQTSREGA